LFQPKRKVDSEMYPEAYRKEQGRSKTLHTKKEDAPFDICQIEHMSVDDWQKGCIVDPSKVKLRVRLFLKSPATKLESGNTLCPHLLFYSDKSISNYFIKQLRT